MIKKILITILTLGLACGFFLMLHTAEQDENHLASHVISHRGASGERIEHTFAAYDLALQQGSHYIEQDLVTSKDGTLYVSHDDSAKKVAGVDKRYADLHDTAIDQLRTKNNEPIHTLQSIFDRYRGGHEQPTFVIELKDGAAQVPAFTEIITQNDLENRTIVQAFDDIALRKIRHSFPSMPTLHLVDTQTDLDSSLDKRYIDIIGMNKHLMNQKNIKRIHDDHKKVSVWTVNSDKDITAAIQLGVDSYFTNYTGRALTLERIHRK